MTLLTIKAPGTCHHAARAADIGLFPIQNCPPHHRLVIFPHFTPTQSHLPLQVSLGYFGAEESPDVDAAAPGWPGLPLRALDFDSNSGEFRLGAPALDALGRLGSCLTQLALSGGVLVETTPTGLYRDAVVSWSGVGYVNW